MWGKVGRAKEEICLSRWKMEKGSPEFEFLLKELLCMPSWIGRSVPIPTLSFPLRAFAYELLLPLYPPHTLGFDLCFCDPLDCVLPWWHPPWGLHTTNAFIERPSFLLWMSLRTGPINHKWSTSDTAVMVKAGLCGRGRLGRWGSKDWKERSIFLLVELFLQS